MNLRKIKILLDKLKNLASFMYSDNTGQIVQSIIKLSRNLLNLTVFTVVEANHPVILVLLLQGINFKTSIQITQMIEADLHFINL